MVGKKKIISALEDQNNDETTSMDLIAKKRKLAKAASELAQIELQIEEIEKVKRKRKQDLFVLTVLKPVDTKKTESDDGFDSSSAKKNGRENVIHEKARLSFE